MTQDKLYGEFKSGQQGEEEERQLIDDAGLDLQSRTVSTRENTEEAILLPPAAGRSARPSAMPVCPLTAALYRSSLSRCPSATLMVYAAYFF